MMNKICVRQYNLVLILFCTVFGVSDVQATKRSAESLTQDVKEVDQYNQEVVKKRAIENSSSFAPTLPPLKQDSFNTWQDVYYKITQNPTEVADTPELQTKVLRYFFHYFTDIPASTLAPLIPDLRKRASFDAQALWLLILSEINTSRKISPHTIPLIKTLLKRKDSDALLVLGECYYNGWGPKRNPRTGFKLIELAAQQGDAIAQCRLGFAYFYGEGVNQEYSNAIEWWYKAALQGCARAQYKLGHACFYGKGVKQDYLDAILWYHKAAQQGYSFAYNDLGKAYFYGQEILPDHKTAFWYSLRAEKAAFDLNGLFIQMKRLYKPTLTRSAANDIEFIYTLKNGPFDLMKIEACSAHLTELNRTLTHSLKGDQDTFNPARLSLFERSRLRHLYENQSAIKKLLSLTLPEALSRPGLLITNLTFEHEVKGRSKNNAFMQYFTIEGQPYLCLGEEQITFIHNTFALFDQTEALISTLFAELNTDKATVQPSAEFPEPDSEAFKQEAFRQRLACTLIDLKIFTGQVKDFTKKTILGSTAYRNLIFEQEFGCCFD